jgi:hypothetical protein
MSISVDLTADQIAELRRVTNQSDDSAAVRAAAEEYLRYMWRMELKSLSGRVEMLDNWSELERLELEAMRKHADESGSR